jgi:hypothetical protein
MSTMIERSFSLGEERLSFVCPLLGHRAPASDFVELPPLLWGEFFLTKPDRDFVNLPGELEGHVVILADGRAGVFTSVERLVQ